MASVGGVVSAAKAERAAILALIDQRIAGLRNAPHVARELRELRNDVATAKHRTAPPPLEIVRRPRMISTLPEADQARALAHDEQRRERQRQAGTLPKTMPAISTTTKETT